MLCIKKINFTKSYILTKLIQNYIFKSVYHKTIELTIQLLRNYRFKTKYCKIAYTNLSKA